MPWREKLHPRDPDGEFIPKGGGGWLRRLGARLSGSTEYKPGSDITSEVVRDWHKYDLGRGTRDQGDLELQAIAKRQGWHAPAPVGTKEELDRAIAEGGIEIFRALNGADTDQTRQWMQDAATGPKPRFGHGIYTNGNYASVNRDALLHSYYADHDHQIQRMVLMPHARVLTWKSDEYAEMQRRAYAASEHSTLYGASAAAAAGYDAIRIPEGNDDGTGRNAEQYIILNRTAVLFQELGPAPHQFDLVGGPQLSDSPTIPEDMRGAKTILALNYAFNKPLRDTTEYYDEDSKRWTTLGDDQLDRWSAGMERKRGTGRDRIFIRKRR